MTKSPDPERWSATLPASDPLADALRAAREELPAPERLERVLGAVVSAGSGAGGGGSLDPVTPGIEGGATLAGASGAGLGAWSKALAVIAIGAASVGAAVLVGRPAAAPTEAPPPVRTTSPSQPAAATAEPPPPAAAESAAAPLATSSERARPTAAAGEEHDDTIETSLLREAQASVSSAPQRALELVAEAERRFPRGALGQERTVIRVQALLALGRRDEALAAARALLRASPRTAHRPRLEQLLPELRPERGAEP